MHREHELWPVPDPERFRGYFRSKRHAGARSVPMGSPTGAKRRSRAVIEGVARAPARAFLRGMGLSDDDLSRPFVGVANTWNEVTPCQMNLDRVGRRVKEGVREAGGTPR